MHSVRESVLKKAGTYSNWSSNHCKYLDVPFTLLKVCEVSPMGTVFLQMFLMAAPAHHPPIIQCNPCEDGKSCLEGV